MILLIDNYDSFTYNLVQYFGELGQEVRVFRNDAIAIADIARLAPQFLVISPGPCTPAQAGVSLNAIREFAGKIPLLGVCLGHQAIGEAFGGTVDRAPELLHGKTSQVHHANSGVLQGLPDPFTATRYHSLTILPETVPDELEVIARTAGDEATGKGGVIMAVRHVDLPIHGVQFHPESILTEGGHRMLANWLGFCGAAPDENLVTRLEREVAGAVAAATTRNSA